MTPEKPVVWFALALVCLCGISARAFSQEPEACGADLTNYVLPCFEAYETDLRPYHYTEIENIADAIAKRVLNSADQVEVIAVYGYGVFFNPDDPVIHNSQERARKVTAALDQKLRNRGLQLKKNQFVSMGIGDNATPEQSASQEGRWLLRRVEISVTYEGTRQAAKKDCEPDKEMVTRLKNFDKNYSNPGREDAVRCMTDLLTAHYSCAKKNGAQYFHTANTNVAEKAGFVERFEQGRKPFHDYACGGKKGEELKNCLGSLDKDIIQGMDTLSRIIMRDSIEAQRSHVPKFAECRVGRWMLDQSESNSRSPYQCYPYQMEGFKVCRP
jgi:hypothetical protein